MDVWALVSPIMDVYTRSRAWTLVLLNWLWILVSLLLDTITPRQANRTWVGARWAFVGYGATHACLAPVEHHATATTSLPHPQTHLPPCTAALAFRVPFWVGPTRFVLLSSRGLWRSYYSNAVCILPFCSGFRCVHKTFVWHLNYLHHSFHASIIFTPLLCFFSAYVCYSERTLIYVPRVPFYNALLMLL